MNKFFLILLITLPLSAPAKTVRYELVVTKNKINLSGKQNVDFALAVNNQIPAPVLEFTEGDEAEIVVKNQIPDDELSIHWHGILLPVEMDGVPYVTTPPILSGEQYTFKFKLRQNGTYWYHSHTNVQEQKGVYGAFIVHPKQKTIKADKDLVLVLSDWSDENAIDILNNLHKDGDYYIYKKQTMRSWLGAIQAGELKTFLNNEWINMGGMDYSDVGYDAFLINGKTESQLINAKKGERIRLRIINAAASTYFHLALADQKLNVISADGIDIEPVRAKEILIGMAETYDVLFELPEQKNYQFKITAQDGTGFASGFIGSGEKILAPTKPMPSLYEGMNHGGEHQGHSAEPSHSGHNMHHHMHHQPMVLKQLTVDDLKSKTPTTYKGSQVYDLKLVLGGDMERYVWHINNKAIHEERNITVKEGDVVRFTFENQTMMHHPMHLHGHFLEY
ncbi:MAG: multicopper oxidase domain-containing protein [Oligoflexia bacterium]|nr:multicopper oxidase domain-containing protein [Oligoflexia bacterium]